MAEHKKLVSLIQRRQQLNDAELETYYKEMKKIIDVVSNCIINKNDNCDTVSAKDNFSYLCWDKLEGVGDESNNISQNNKHLLINVLSYTEFNDDNHLKKYLYKVFENLFLSELSKKAPQYISRKKQVNRVLKNICLKKVFVDSEKKIEMWILNSSSTDFSEISINEKNEIISKNQPPELEQLKTLANKISLPEISYPKSKEFQRGARIKDKDMKLYLERLFCLAGGSIPVEAMDRLIKDLFGNVYMDHVSIDNFESTPGSSSKGDSDINKGEYLMNKENSKKLMPGADHILLAKKCLNSMSADQQCLVYCIYGQGMNQGETARKMNKSDASITNMKKELIHYLYDFLGVNKSNHKDKFQMTYEEGEIILKLITELIYKKQAGVI